MPFNPDASWFIPFHEHDPSTNDQCIYFTQGGTRCRWSCQTRDNTRGIELYGIICSLPAGAVGIELIKDYILCNCCRSGRAQHRDRIEDVGLWTPLAERWLDEIRSRAAEQSSRTVSVSPLEASAILPATPTPGHVTTAYTTSRASSPHFQSSTPISSSINTTPPTSVASSSAYQNASPKTPTTSAGIAPLPSGDQPHYGLRPRNTHISTSAISVQPTTISQSPRSEFRAHIAEPGPTDSVSSKIQDILVDRDFETGSLYIFDRDSSPGYVKIGWTAGSVTRRLESWSKCEYTPNLLFSVGLVPHAQRAETLTHYELIMEWRRERQCQAQHCRKSHQEWFKVSKDRAKEVVGDWAKFMEIAEPYDSMGVLKARGKTFVKRTVTSGETVTAKKLLEHRELSLAEDTTLVGEPAVPGCALKIEEQEGDDLWSTTKLEELEGPKKPSVHPDSLRIEQPAATKDTLPVPFVSDSLFGTEPILKTNPLHEDVPAKRALADKGLSPERIPLPPSPLVRPVDSQDILFMQVTEPGPRPEIEKPSVTNIITKSNTSSVATPSSESKNPSNASATSFPKPKSKPASGLSAPLAKEVPGGQEKAIAPASITQSQHNAEEEGGQGKPESELDRCERQVPKNEIKFKDEDQGVVAKIKSETGEDGWDEEETLVEVLAPGFLEKAALGIVGLCNEISTGKTDGLSKASDELKGLESEVLPVVEVVAQV